MVNKSRAYILKIKSRDEEYYTFSTIPYISADNSFRIFYYTSISINRQNLQLTTHYPDENYARVLDCQRDNSDVRKLFENVKTQANVNSQNQKRDEISRKEKLLKEAQF